MALTALCRPACLGPRALVRVKPTQTLPRLVPVIYLDRPRNKAPVFRSTTKANSFRFANRPNTRPSRREGRKVARDGGGAARVVRDAPPESRGNCSLRSESRQGRLRFLLERFAVGVEPRPMAHSYSARLGTELGKSQLPDTISYLQRQGRVFDRVRPLQVGDQSIVPPGLGSQATAYPGWRRGYARKARAQPRLHPGLLSVPPCGREHKGPLN